MGLDVTKMDGSRITTLIVDDEPVARRLLREELENFEEIEVVGEAANGREALQQIAKLKPELVFLDLQMPVVNGWQVLDWIHSFGRKGKMRIFIYSQPRNITEVSDLYKLKADSFIRKPATQEEIQDLIRNFPEPWELEKATMVQ